MFTDTILIGVAMAAVFLILRSVVKMPLTLAFILTAIVGTLAGRFGLPLRHLVEGMFGYFYLILILFTGAILIQVVQESGTLDVIVRGFLARFHRRPVLLLLMVAIMLFVAGMFTGFGGVAVLTAGVIVAPILMRVGIPRVEAGAIIVMISIYGMIAPPVNLPAILIAEGTNMPYSGFSLILLAMTVPLAIFTILFLGLRSYTPSSVEAVLEGLPETHGRLRHLIPFIVILLIMILVRVIPQYIPDPSIPLTLMIGALVATMTGNRRINIFKATSAALKGPALTLAGVLMGVGMMVQVMALTGVRGLLVNVSMSLPIPWIYLAVAVSMPLLGGILTALGSASVLGVPFGFAFIGGNTIVNASALSLMAGLAELVLPTAISGVLAAQVVGENNYLKIWRRCWVPTVVTAIVAILFIIFSVPLGRVLT
ncbi:MAG: TRAP transporter large permease [Thermodesulfobacteriota bacterium]